MTYLDQLKSQAAELSELIKSGEILCLATHPDKPDYSSNARGRKLHRAKNETLTFCDMQITQIVDQTETHLLSRTVCRVCFK